MIDVGCVLFRRPWLMTAGSCKRREFWNERGLFSQRLPAMEHIFFFSDL